MLDLWTGLVSLYCLLLTNALWSCSSLLIPPFVLICILKWLAVQEQLAKTESIRMLYILYTISTNEEPVINDAVYTSDYRATLLWCVAKVKQRSAVWRHTGKTTAVFLLLKNQVLIEVVQVWKRKNKRLWEITIKAETLHRGYKWCLYRSSTKSPTKSPSRKTRNPCFNSTLCSTWRMLFILYNWKIRLNIFMSFLQRANACGIGSPTICSKRSFLET